MNQVFAKKTGLQCMLDSHTLFTEILLGFQECHDVCLRSKLFTDETVLSLDQCGIEFRQLLMGTTRIAGRVSNQWLEVVINLFENINDIDDPSEILQLLAIQARELSWSFHLIAAWGRSLNRKFSILKGSPGNTKASDIFTNEFQKAIDMAKNANIEANVKYFDAQKDLGSKERVWQIATFILSTTPRVYGLYSIVSRGANKAHEWVEKAKEIEAAAQIELQKSYYFLNDKISDSDKAKVKYQIAITKSIFS